MKGLREEGGRAAVWDDEEIKRGSGREHLNLPSGDKEKRQVRGE